MSGNLSGLPGFRDFFPAETSVRGHILRGWRRVAARYGFAEYDGPPLEPLELYVRKSGEEIVGQLYAFTDQGGRQVALRPEMTPTFARMVGARAAGLPKPIRWFAVPQVFRYERPQKGRLREHFQLNMDIVGEAGALADAEIIAAALDVCREFGLDHSDVVARVSDRGLLTEVLAGLGVPRDAMGETFAVLDRLGRHDHDELRDRLMALGVSDTGADRLLALGVSPVSGLDEFLEEFTAEPGVREAGSRTRQVIAHLESAGLGPFIQFDPTLVRGLAYYTGMVFELWDRRGEHRAICGGGRYDGLLAAVGGPDLPALGFGMGDVVLGEILAARGLLPERQAATQDHVVCVTADQRSMGLRVAHLLRDAGRTVTYDFGEKSVGRQFKSANQLGAARAIVIGPEEQAQDSVLIRDLATGDERRVAVSELEPGD